eukprot:7942686-Alexandrium_andersonii.AAC.1
MVSEEDRDAIARHAQVAMSYAANAETGPIEHFEQAGGLMGVRSRLSVPERLRGPDADDDDGVSQVCYTPIQSEFTSGDEAGGRLGSEATSLDDESSDDATECVTTDPYEEAVEV